MPFEYWWGYFNPPVFAYVILLGWKMLGKKKINCYLAMGGLGTRIIRGRTFVQRQNRPSPVKPFFAVNDI